MPVCTSLITQPSLLKGQLAGVPHRPGVYRYYDADNLLLYVGKAKDLKKRVSSYFQRQGKHESIKTEILVSRIARLDFLVTANETEALLLEINLIKAHKPPYNISLRDDKRYPWICIPNEPFPRVFLTRRRFLPAKGSLKNSAAEPKKNKTRYYGPYTDAQAARQLLHMIRQYFPVRQRRTPLFTDRPCMNYSIGLCPGPCQYLITEAAYEQTLQQIGALLKGNHGALLAMLSAEMKTASEAKNYEWAAQLRDRYRAVEKLLGEQQRVSLEDASLSMDVIGVAPLPSNTVSAFSNNHSGLVLISSIREGRVVRVRPFPLEGEALGANTDDLTGLLEALPRLLVDIYEDDDADSLPDEVLIPDFNNESFANEAFTPLAIFLNQKRNAAAGASKKRAALNIIFPKRGTKKELLDRVAAQAYEQWLSVVSVSDDASWKATDGLVELARTLGLPKPPARMECYDISHVQGSHTVASMVVFENGKPHKAEYRRFNLKTTEGKPDDFTSMREALLRRATHCQESPLWDGKTPWPTPSVFVIDGGKGQLSSAVEALTEAGLGHIPVVSLAKRLEEVFTPGNSQPIVLPRNSAALFVLQQLRDEAHRFAITHHRKRRGVAATQSALDGIKGLGDKRKQHLLNTFGSVATIAQQSEKNLVSAGKLPPSVARTVLLSLSSHQKSDTPG
ncbi:MAG: excinuclease ABC subunit UvrC [Vampirovibrionales bacterium]|nr:excinuclease ABC subunit UvrC [Vampirovibrionales bacterium]